MTFCADPHIENVYGISTYLYLMFWLFLIRTIHFFIWFTSFLIVLGFFRDIFVIHLLFVQVPEFLLDFLFHHMTWRFTLLDCARCIFDAFCLSVLLHIILRPIFFICSKPSVTDGTNNPILFMLLFDAIASLFDHQVGNVLSGLLFVVSVIFALHLL